MLTLVAAVIEKLKPMYVPRKTLEQITSAIPIDPKRKFNKLHTPRALDYITDIKLRMNKKIPKKHADLEAM